MSLKQIKKSILLTKKMGGEFFSHAGFRLDPKPKI